MNRLVAPILIRVSLVFGLAVFAPLLVPLGRTRGGRLVGANVCFLWLTAVWVVVRIGSPGWVGNPAANPLAEAVTTFAVCGSLISPVLAGSCFLAVVLLASAYRTEPVEGLESAFLLPCHLNNWHFALVPEADWVAVAAWVVTRLDPRIPRADARRIRETVGRLLDEMDEYPEYAVLYPALPLTAWSAASGPDTGHHLAYTPPREPGERLGLVVALHGHGGNAALWLHAWRPFADDHRFAVVCPTFGHGNWEHPAGATCVTRCLDDALSRDGIDPRRVYLAGLSQGGAGVGRAATDRFAGLIFLSPTMEADVLTDPALAGRKAFVAYGGRDRNVTPASVEAGLAALRAAGADVTVWLAPAADHFLFFAGRGELFDRLAAWVRQEPPPFTGP